MQMRNSAAERGSVLLLVTVFLMVAAAFGLTMLAEYTIVDDVRATDNGALLKQVYEAIAGNPDQGLYGYLGDMGEYPASLVDLLRNPGSSSAWNGPYLTDVHFDGAAILDSYFSPLEYYLDATPGSAHRLAIISRGPDHSSTNTAANPNIAAQFAGVLPTNASYATGSGNADNVRYPDFIASADSLTYKNTGTVAMTLTNVDTDQGSAVVSACPRLYYLELTSARRTTDRLRIAYDAGILLEVLQGRWSVRVTSPRYLNDAYSDWESIIPSTTTSRSLRLFPTEFDTMPQGTITIVNQWGSQLTITYEGTSFNVNTGATRTHGNALRNCGTFQARTGGSNGTIRYEWNMPYGATAQRVVVSNVDHTLTVTNLGGGEPNIGVWVHGNTLNDANPAGNVYERSVRTFTIRGGNTVWITNAAGSQIDTFVMSGPLSRQY
jgi:hypothetical protein